jgi:hypothetical protein
MKQVRFWVLSPCGGAVRLKLKVGKPLHHYWATPTDEGWSSEWYRWHFDGRTIWRDWHHDGRDCDGRSEAGGIEYCELKDLAAFADADGIAFPHWQSQGDWQRDYSAEAAGY